MSMRQLVIAITFLAIFAMALRVSVDTDTWWHLRTGELIAEQHSIPKTDTFSFTRAGEAWLYPSAAWLSELKLFLFYDYFGPGGLNLWVAASVMLAFAFVYFTLSGGHFLRAFTLVLAAATSAVYWAARPYLVTFIFSAMFLWILEDFRWRRNNRLIWLPFIMILWANSHPGFAIGFILLAIYFVDELVGWLGACWKARSGPRIKRADLRAALHGRLGAFLLVGAGLLVAVSINPSGPAMLRYPFETLSIGVLRDFIQEWQSPDFHQLNVLPFALLLLASLAILGFSRQRIVPSDLLLVLVFGFLALLAGRNIALFALVAPVVLSRHAQPLLDELSKKLGLHIQKKRAATKWQMRLNAAILLILLAAVLVKASFVLPAGANVSVYEDDLPLGAVSYIQREQPPGAMFNSYNWGGYLIWALRDYPVFVDGRTDLYSDQILTEWLDIVGAEPGWQTKLDAWDIQLILLEPRWPLSKLLVLENWQLLYEDEISVLYGR